mgnify:FL=1
MIQFGIEMEGYGLTQREIEDAMEASGAIHSGFFRYHGGGSHDSKREGNYTWKTEEDGSLRGIAPFVGHQGRDTAGHHEIISPILYGKEGQLHAEKVWRNLTKAGFQVNNKTGTHITMGGNHNARFNRMSQAKKTQVGIRIAQIYKHFMPVFDAMSPNARSGANGYCYPPNVRSPFSGRTSAVNLTRWVLYGIVEFRQFGYTTEIKNFRGWMKVLDSLVAASFNENHKSHGADLSQVPQTWEAMADFLNIGAKATRWGQARIHRLCTNYRTNRANRMSVLGIEGGEQ